MQQFLIHKNPHFLSPVLIHNDKYISKKILYSSWSPTTHSHTNYSGGACNQDYYSADSTSEALVANIFFTFTTTTLFLMPTTSQLQIISLPQPLFKPHINTKDGFE